jgi:hypothetical protein
MTDDDNLPDFENECLFCSTPVYADCSIWIGKHGPYCSDTCTEADRSLAGEWN